MHHWHPQVGGQGRRNVSQAKSNRLHSRSRTVAHHPTSHLELYVCVLKGHWRTRVHKAQWSQGPCIRFHGH
eukprot:7847106-Alexandrium_andersonii.AAC.1